MLVLTQFVLRLSFGLALAMGLTSPKKVTSGYFRNHSYVLLGLNVLALVAALASLKTAPWISNSDPNQSIEYRNEPAQAPAKLHVWPPLVGVILSYVCSAVWLYEKPKAGRSCLLAIAAISLVGAWVSQPLPFFSEREPMPWRYITLYNTSAKAPSDVPLLLWRLDALTSGLVLGSTIAAMFLGHWYLNTPTMELKPLRNLLVLMMAAVALQTTVSGSAVGLEASATEVGLMSSQYPLLALRWIAGIVGTAALIYMAWQTLKIPNTQSATGILYVAVITTFLGELTSLLLSGSTGFPL